MSGAPRRARAAIVLVVALAAGCLGPVAGLYPPDASGPTRTVWVVGHGWHVGLVLRARDVPAALWPERRDFAGATHLEVGWGDREFYRTPNPTLTTALRAAVASGGSVLHVAAFDGPVERYFPDAGVVEVTLSPRGFEALCRFIDASHARDGRERATPLGPGWYGRSRFYPATGRYHLLNTCNTWVAEALRAAGCPITPVWAVTAGNVMSQAARFGRPVR